MAHDARFPLAVTPSSTPPSSWMDWSMEAEVEWLLRLFKQNRTVFNTYVTTLGKRVVWKKEWSPQKNAEALRELRRVVTSIQNGTYFLKRKT